MIFRMRAVSCPKVSDSNFPPEQKKPDHVEHHAQGVVGTFHLRHFPAERSESGDSQFDGLQTEGDTDDSQA